MIPWIPIITAGASILGSVLGKDESVKKNENTETKEAQTGVGSTKAQSATTQNSTQNQNSSSASNQNSSETQQGNISRLDGATTDLLTQKVQEALAGMSGADAAKTRLQEVMGQSGDFDVDKFVGGIMTGARGATMVDLESGKNAVTSQAGSRRNSATALLKGKLDRQASESLASTEAQATAQGMQIKQGLQESKTGQITTLAAQTDNQIGNLLGALLQASEKQTVNSSGTTAGTTTGNTKTTGTTTENQTTVQDQVTGSTSVGSSKTNSNAAGNSKDWTDIFKNIGSIFGATFEGG